MDFSNDDHPDRVLLRQLDAAITAVDGALDGIDFSSLATADRNVNFGADERKLRAISSDLRALRALAADADRSR